MTNFVRIHLLSPLSPSVIPTSPRSVILQPSLSLFIVLALSHNLVPPCPPLPPPLSPATLPATPPSAWSAERCLRSLVTVLLLLLGVGLFAMQVRTIAGAAPPPPPWSRAATAAGP